MKSKYVIIEHDGMEAAVVFSPLLLHLDVVGKSKVKSAGFCRMNGNGNWLTDGHLVSLDCDARPNDAEILKELL